MKVFCRAVSDMSMALGCARLGMSTRILPLSSRPSAQALLGPAAGTPRQLACRKRRTSAEAGKPSGKKMHCP